MDDYPDECRVCGERFVAECRCEYNALQARLDEAARVIETLVATAEASCGMASQFPCAVIDDSDYENDQLNACSEFGCYEAMSAAHSWLARYRAANPSESPNGSAGKEGGGKCCTGGKIFRSRASGLYYTTKGAAGDCDEIDCPRCQSINAAATGGEGS